MAKLELTTSYAAVQRRRFLQAVGAAAMSFPAQGQQPAEVLNNTAYENIKGFNYVPSYAFTIWDAIDSFQEEVWDREFGYSKRFHANTLRVWCDYLSFQKDENGFLRKWERALKLAEKHDLKLLVTTANRWVDQHWQYGQVDLAVVLKGDPPDQYKNYIRTFLGAFRLHPRILMWDLCNEPFFPISNQEGNLGLMRSLLMRRELRFWTSVTETARLAQPSQPLTLGIHSIHDWNPEEIYDLVDVISCHPYAGWWDDAKAFRETCDHYVRIANRLGKPLICTETCQGSKDNRTRTKIIEASLRELERRKIGWQAWQLMAGLHVSSRPDRTDTNCRPGDQSLMYWVEKDGTTRPGHDEKEWRTWG